MPGVDGWPEPPKSGGGLYVRLKDGEAVRLRLCSPPLHIEEEYEYQGKMVKSNRYGFVVLVKAENGKKIEPKAGVYEMPSSVYTKVLALGHDEEWGDPRQYDLTIVRNGGDPTNFYSVTPSPNNKGPLSDAEKALLKEANIHLPDLVGQPRKAAASVQDQDEEDPFE